ncbi:lytic transglycosylase domain-containing protein [Micromonospora sp. NPDC050417]|uniref:aggregation-promoting factor C-terminal-like domain-containing protein n=1 Tax=Micromonospora sp. NPDC050417 TaxID=3364280 RepID=UPI0037AFA089
MSRLWSRYGVRTLAVSMLLVGVAGGYFLGEDRETQQSGINAQIVADAERAEFQLLRERNAAHKQAMAAQVAAEQEATRKAAETAKAAAERARKADAAADRKKREQRAANAPAKPYDGPIPASCNEYSGNRAVGCALMLEAGFPIAEMPCLEKLWTKESGWNPKASNPSGAYGIPQAKPGSKMSAYGADWQNSAATQIKWGLSYIKGRYKSPCGAWTYFQNNGYY